MANTTGIEQVNVGGTPYEIMDAAARKMISDEYNSAETYAKGNLCIYNGKIYEAIKETTGTWDATAWEKTTLAKVNSKLNGDIASLTEKIKISEGGYIGVRPFWEDGVIYLDFMRDSKNGAIICFNANNIVYFKVENGTQTRIWSK